MLGFHRTQLIAMGRFREIIGLRLGHVPWLFHSYQMARGYHIYIYIILNYTYIILYRYIIIIYILLLWFLLLYIL
jgi:hypothetical protein